MIGDSGGRQDLADGARTVAFGRDHAPRKTARHRIGPAGIFVLLLQSSRALAEATPADRAVALGRAALADYSDGAWASAYEHFAEADQVAHSPVFVLYMARCKRNSGELLKARELLRAVSREVLPPSAPAPWQQAVAAAHAELGSLQQSIPSLWLRVEFPTVATIDGRTVAISSTAQELELDPGEHVIEFQDRRGERARRTIHVPEGRRRLPLTLDEEAPALPKPNPRPAHVVDVPRGENALPSVEGWRRVGGWAAVGVGVAGVGLGIFAGLKAKGQGDRLRCSDDGHCLREDLSTFETASDWAAISTVSFIFSGSLLLSGGALLVLPPSIGSRARAGVGMKAAF